MNLKEELQKFLKGEVEDSEETLKKYSHDASLFEVKPQLVVFPKDVEDIENLVQFLKNHPEEKLSIVARGAGTDMTGGPLGESIVLDMTRHFNRIEKIGVMGDGTPFATAQPGVFYKDFEKETLKKGLLMPSYPASKEMCTLGGIVANNSGGEKSLVYGKTERYVRQLKMVLADGKEHTFQPLSAQGLAQKLKEQSFEGELVRKLYQLIEENKQIIKGAKPAVSKNSAGYFLWNVRNGEMFDLPKLLVGSQGTFGIITEITFSLVRPKMHSTLLVLFLNNVALIPEIVNTLLKYKPESLESYDDHTLKFAMAHLSDFISILKGNIISLAFQFIPEFFMFLRQGFRLPKLVVLVEFTGDSEEEIYRKAYQARDALSHFSLQMRVTKNDKEEDKYFTVRRESFNLLRHHLKNQRTAPFIDDIIVRPEYLPEFLPKLSGILAHYPKLMYTIAGHIGDGNFHIIPIMSLNNESDKEIIPQLAKEVYDLVLQYKGSLTAEHNDGIIRTPYLEQMYGKEICDLFAQVKNIFDPQHIFNPGKKTGGTLDYALSRIVLR